MAAHHKCMVSDRERDGAGKTLQTRGKATQTGIGTRDKSAWWVSYLYISLSLMPLKIKIQILSLQF